MTPDEVAELRRECEQDITEYEYWPPTTVLPLLAEIERLQARLAQAEEMCRAADDFRRLVDDSVEPLGAELDDAAHRLFDQYRAYRHATP